MKVYLAARHGRQENMLQVAAVLREFGHEVTSRWLETEWAAIPDQSSAIPPEYMLKYALIDMEDVAKSEVVVSFTESPGDVSRGGRHVEFGIAAAWGKRLIVVGHRENRFHHLPRVEFCKDAEELFDLICK